jgi:hypothetical protein
MTTHHEAERLVLHAVLEKARRHMVQRAGTTFGAARVWTVTIAELEGIVGDLYPTTHEGDHHDDE